MAVPVLAHRDNLTFQRIQSGEKRRGAIAFVVVVMVPQRPFFIGGLVSWSRA